MTAIIKKEDLFNQILVVPSSIYDTLCVVSGFATPSMVVHHLEAVKNIYDIDNINIKLIVGMTPIGIPKPHHENFIKLVNEKQGLFECSYINANSFPIHSKLYIWLRNNKPQQAFLSSANYTLNGFKGRQDEIAVSCNPIQAYEYYNSKINLSLYCTCEESANLVTNPINTNYKTLIHSTTEEDNYNGPVRESVRLPLFSERDGIVPTRSGLNWGQREGREHNQAYIAIPSEIAKSGFFPPRGEQFSVLTEDGFPFIFVVAQDGDKALHTPNNNSEIGEYFRNRLGVPLGQPVTLADLDRFGNRYVKFTKIDEEEYYMEYSPSES